VGAETAKNLILAGPRRVTLCDEEAVSVSDLGTNFCLKPELVGVSRARASVKMLAELNEYVSVDVLEGGVASVSPTVLAEYGAVVVCKNLPLSTLRAWNDICHMHAPSPILFLVALTRGVTACVFGDFGDTHRITDVDGEPLRVNVIESIQRTVNDEFIVEVVAEQHGLDDDTPIS
jgi:ubiquitin-activating enzyme E1